MENIKFQLDYKSQNKNGWPLIMVTVNDMIVDRFVADSNKWQGEFSGELLDKNFFRIWHFGKNYHIDHAPDKFFQLEKFYINGVDLKHHIHRFRQTAFLPPWDNEPPPNDSLYLGHEGYIELEFGGPINPWIKKIFNINEQTMHGQQTTRDVLNDVKKFFDL